MHGLAYIYLLILLDFYALNFKCPPSQVQVASWALFITTEGGAFKFNLESSKGCISFLSQRVVVNDHQPLLHIVTSGFTRRKAYKGGIERQKETNKIEG